MLHELLFALSGYPGDIFVENEKKVVSVAKNLPFIHPVEESTLNRLCLLATRYIKLKNFIFQTNGFFDASVGLYMRSFAVGLEICLEPYQKLIIDIEKEVLSDPYLTVAHVVTRTEEYQEIFPTLSGLVDKITENKVHGCEILDVLYKASVCGMPGIRNAVLRILHVCHCTMYKQLTAWLLYGLLYDKNKNTESNFFIQYKAGSDSSKNQKEPEPDNDGEHNKGNNKEENIVISINLLPSYIPLKVAEKILFIGRSVTLFESSQDDKNTTTGDSHKLGRSIMKSKEDEFIGDIKKLSRTETFDLVKFEETIDKIRVYVAEQLWTLIVGHSDLQSHLRCFKDFFLIGRGELFLAFIDKAQNILRNPPTTTTKHDVNLTFQHAARDVLLNEEIFQRFKFIIEELPLKISKTQQQPQQISSMKDEPLQSHATTTFLNTRESGWNCLRMTAAVDWPLHVMFTPNIIKKYSRLFSFLLYVKRIQLELQQCWSIEMHRRHLASNKKISSSRHSTTGSGSLDSPSSFSSAKWRLRNHMAFLVDNLQYYLQVDVIESQYCLLVEKIKTKKDFEQIMLAHECFLASLVDQCFLQSRQINHCLLSIMDLCHAFYGLIAYSESELTPLQQDQFKEISKSFERQSSLLFMILSSVRNNQTSNPHLAQLLLRIDFNKYFSQAQLLSSSQYLR